MICVPVKDLIKEETKSVPEDHVFIGGFSQGGAVALYTALTLGRPLAGVVGISTWLPLTETLKQVFIVF